MVSHTYREKISKAFQQPKFHHRGNRVAHHSLSVFANSLIAGTTAACGGIIRGSLGCFLLLALYEPVVTHRCRRSVFGWPHAGVLVVRASPFKTLTSRLVKASSAHVRVTTQASMTKTMAPRQL